LILAGVSLVIYLPGFSAGFVFDDLPSIVDNRYIRAVRLNPRAIFDAAFQDFRQNRPLTNLSFALNYYLHQLNPLGYHIVNFAVFLFTALGIWLLLRRLFSRLGFAGRRAELAAWLCALLWAVHPLNVQAVTYIVQRHAGMAGCFSVWSIYFYHCSREGTRRGVYSALAVVSGLLAMLSKETALMLPVLVFAYKLYFFDELKPGWLRGNLKWLLLLLVFYCLALFLVLRPSMRGAVFDFSRMAFTGRERFLTEPSVLVWYLLLIVLPLPQFLAIEHGFFPSQGLLSPRYTLLGFAAVLAALIFAVFRARKNRLASFLVLWYFGQLLVEALPLAIDIAAEQRLYLASLSLIVPVVCWLILRTERFRLCAGLLVLVGLFFGGFTLQRNLVWRDNQRLWRDAVKKSPLFSRPANNYCAALAMAGQCERAEKVCRFALAVTHKRPEVYVNLGVCYFKTGHEELGEQAFRTAAELSDNSAIALTNIGMSYALRGEYKKAEQWYLMAIAKQPFYAESHYNLAQVYRATGRGDVYLKELEETLKLRPEWSEARAELGWLLARQGSCREALALVRAAPAADPRFAELISYCQFR
jgi:tetratricopeptide (TPR) repeat protein